MQKVISINLNGNAYQLDDPGTTRCTSTRLRRARARQQPRSHGNHGGPRAGDRGKCQKFLGPHKSIVTTAEVQQIVKEMGPIQPAPGSEDPGHAGATADGAETRSAGPRPRRFYRIPSGGMIAGVCNGLGDYFGVDVTLIRIGFVLATLVTKGAAMLGYVAMMFIVPEAKRRRNGPPRMGCRSTPRK